LTRNPVALPTRPEEPWCTQRDRSNKLDVEIGPQSCTAKESTVTTMSFQPENQEPGILGPASGAQSGAPPTPKTVPNHQKPNVAVMPAWLKFALLTLGIVGFVVALFLWR
jgi:hypothetical protein